MVNNNSKNENVNIPIEKLIMVRSQMRKDIQSRIEAYIRLEAYINKNAANPKTLKEIDRDLSIITCAAFQKIIHDHHQEQSRKT